MIQFLKRAPKEMDFLKSSALNEVEREEKRKNNQISIEPAIMKIHAPPIQVVTSKTKNNLEDYFLSL